jgi:hypothetical protein
MRTVIVLIEQPHEATPRCYASGLSTRLCEHIVSVGLRCALETKLKVLHDPTNSEALLSAAVPTSLPNSYSRAIC